MYNQFSRSSSMDSWVALGHKRAEARDPWAELGRKRTASKAASKWLSYTMEVVSTDSHPETIAQFGKGALWYPATVRFHIAGRERTCSATRLDADWVYVICYGAKSARNGMAYGDDILKVHTSWVTFNTHRLPLNTSWGGPAKE
jgi:hypothetical protein